MKLPAFVQEILDKELGEHALSEFLSQQVEFTKRYFTDHPTKEYSPMLILKLLKKDMKGSETMIMMLTSLNENRFEMFEMIGRKLAEDQHTLLAAVFLSEAWVVLTPQKEPVLRPSQHPDRQEVMIMFLGTINGKSNGRIFKIDRDDRNNIGIGEPVMEGDDAKMESPLLQQLFFGYADLIRKRTMN